MSNKEFWEDDPNLLWAYRKSYMDKKEIQKEIDNYNAWLNGLYTFEAISKGLYNALQRKPTQPVLNYIEKPYDFKNYKSKEEIQKEQVLRVEEQIRERNKQIKEMLKNKK